MDKPVVRNHGELTESDIRGWVERNAKSMLPDIPFTPDELDHVAMCMRHIYLWYREGRPIGDFLSAVVCNNFSEACVRADSVNQKALCLYALCANKIGSDYREKATGAVSALKLCRNLLDFAEHGDYSNGNEAYGVDEGRVRAGEVLDAYRKEVEALEAKYGRR